MTRLAIIDILIIDDLALEPVNHEESRDIYQLFVERNARFSTVVTRPAIATYPNGSPPSTMLCSPKVPSTTSRAAPSISSSTVNPIERDSSRTSKPSDLRLRLR
jgi:uncharacterized protein YfkK (UPF0435 family)